MPLVELPGTIKAVTRGGDNCAAGRAVVVAVGEAFAAQRCAVFAVDPSTVFRNWNDELTGNHMQVHA